MDLSIVIVSYRTPEHLRRCLNVLAGYRSPLALEIIVVDNESGDESPAVARSFSGVTVVETGSNLGFAGGVNRGLAVAHGRYALVLNPDVEVGEGSLDALVAFMDAHPETGLAGPKLLNGDGTLQHSCRRFYTLNTILLRRTPLGKLFPNAPALRRHLMLDYDHAAPRPVDWVTGAAMIVRREALADVGPMDERYFLYFEDVDWCTRMQARGWLVQYVPASVMTHHWQHASGVGLGRAARTHLRSGIRFYERWGTLLYVLRQYRAQWTTAALLALDLLAIVGAFLIAFFVRRELNFILEKPVWPLATYRGFLFSSTLVFLGTFAANGLYRGIKEGDWVDVAFRVGRATTIAALVVMGSTFVLNMQGYSRVMVLGSWPAAALLTFAVRFALASLGARVRRDRLGLRRVALVGPDAILDRLESVLREKPELGWEPIRMRTQPAAGTPADAAEALGRRLAVERVHEVVVTPASLGAAEEDLAGALLPLRRAGMEVRVISAFLAGLPPRARLEGVGPYSWLSLTRPGLGPARVSKRVIDVLVSVLLLVLGLAPFFLAVLRRAATGRVREPEEVLAGQWGEPVTVRRLSGTGRIRHYPLLLAVLRGWLSLVGPRPLAPGSEIPGGPGWGRVRERHRPGLVGPWSLHPASTPDEEMQQELRYLEEWTPEADLKLLTRVALRRSGGSPGPGSAAPAARDASPPRPVSHPGSSPRGEILESGSSS